MTISPGSVETLAKAELYDYPLVGRLMDAFGVIWLHRGQPDRRALRAALDGLRQGRMVAISPEGRESVTGALEEGTGGAAYLAIKSGAPVLPVTFTGTENSRIYGNLKHLRRTEVTITIGPLFQLEDLPDRHQAIEAGTHRIMRTLASQLPSGYRGVYSQ
jgi:1-acyl-sn-glycerol-3-phosphate acyltransferase